MDFRFLSVGSVALLLLSAPSCQLSKARKQAQVTRVNARHYVVENRRVLHTKEQILAHRPPQIPAHARLWESNEDHDFMIYGWVAYDQAADLNNNIHHLRVYDDDGSLLQEGYYAVLRPQTTLLIDYADYAIEHPLGNLIRLTTRGTDFFLLYINYKHTYQPHFGSAAPDKARFVPVPMYNPATGRTQPDVLLKSYPLGKEVKITVETELHTFTTARYALVNIGSKNAPPPLMPYRFKFMDPGTARIYLIEKDWALAKRSEQETEG